MAKSLPIALFAANPGAPTVTPTGGAAGSYSYKLVAVAADGTTSAAGTAGTTSTGPTTLDSTHYNTVNPTALHSANPNAVSFDVYRTAGGATQGKIGNVLNDGAATLDDKALVADGSTAPTTNTTGVGTAVDVSGLRDLTVEVNGTFVATLQLQARLDHGGDFENVGSTVSSAGFVDITATVKAASQLRMKMTAFTSGSPVAEVAGNVAH